MSVNWTTFLLEVVNFLVLVWILKRFFYRPVLNVIEARRLRIQEERERVDALRHEAEALQERAQAELAGWERERQAKRDALTQELEQERAQRLEALEASLEDERRKAEASREEHERELQDELENRALEHGARFAARFMERLSGPELETRLAELLIEEIAGLSEARRERIRATFGAGDIAEFQVSSTRPLDKPLVRRLTQALQQALGVEAPVTFTEDPDLIAGLRVNVGYWVLGANVRDDLRFFAENERDVL